MFTIISIVFLFIFSLVKIYSKKTEKFWETLLVILALVTALISYNDQNVSSYKEQRKNVKDSIQHAIETKAAKQSFDSLLKQNDSLKKSIELVQEDNHLLIRNFSDFDRLYHITIKRQDSLNDFISGGDNLPLMIARNVPAVQIINNQSHIVNTIAVELENMGIVPLTNISYNIINPITHEKIEKEILSMTYQFSKGVFDFNMPDNVDSLGFGGLIIWSGRNLRAYSFNFFIKRDSKGQINVTSRYFYVGSRLGEEFDPFKNKALYFPKAKKG